MNVSLQLSRISFVPIEMEPKKDLKFAFENNFGYFTYSEH